MVDREELALLAPPQTGLRGITTGKAGAFMQLRAREHGNAFEEFAPQIHRRFSDFQFNLRQWIRRCHRTHQLRDALFDVLLITAITRRLHRGYPRAVPQSSPTRGMRLSRKRPVMPSSAQQGIVRTRHPNRSRAVSDTAVQQPPNLLVFEPQDARIQVAKQ